MILIAKNIR